MHFKKFLVFYIFFSLIIVSSLVAQSDIGTIFSVNFEKDQFGYYMETRIRKDFGDIKWALTGNRGRIHDDQEHGRVLEVYYPKGSVGPSQNGLQFIRNLPQSDTYYLDYFIMFDDDFSFKKGGKLPGLTSGGDKYTGGNDPVNGDGWSARFMWQSSHLIVYLYYIDMKEKYGEAIQLNSELETGVWHRITQYIKINDVGETNAEIKVWFNEELVGGKSDFRLRKGDVGRIDAFYFSTFHGGATADWAPDNDSFIYFDDLYVGKVAPKFLNGK